MMSKDIWTAMGRVGAKLLSILEGKSENRE